MPGQPSWAPTLADVARHIPTRTRDAKTPGSDELLGTFTESTTPTGEQAQGFVDDAVRWVTSECGDLPANFPPTDELMVAARTAAEWRAAADIELGYPLNRDPDIQLYRTLDLRTKDALSTVRSAMAGEGVGQVDLVPSWHFPPVLPPSMTRVRFIDGEGWTWDALRDNC
jgi:hypothetical protein